jgi:hypothetical protein
MQDEPLTGKPVSPAEQALLDAYYQEPVKQADRFVDLARELLKLELAIPGIYAAALRLVSREQSANPNWVFIAFSLWLIALVLTLCALFPRRYQVLEQAIRHVRPDHGKGPLSIKEYFQKSARVKRLLLLWAVPLFFCGIIAAVLAVFE